MVVSRPCKVMRDISSIVRRSGGLFIYKNLVADHLFFERVSDEGTSWVSFMLMNYTPTRPKLLRLKSLLEGGRSYGPPLDTYGRLRPLLHEIAENPFPKFEIYFLYEELGEFIPWVVNNYWRVSEQYPMAARYMPLAEGVPISPYLATEKAQAVLDEDPNQ